MLAAGSGAPQERPSSQEDPMSGVNKGILIGNLGGNPEVRYARGAAPTTICRLKLTGPPPTGGALRGGRRPPPGTKTREEQQGTRPPVKKGGTRKHTKDHLILAPKIAGTSARAPPAEAGAASD